MLEDKWLHLLCDSFWQINGGLCFIVHVGRSLVECVALCIVADQYFRSAFAALCILADQYLSVLHCVCL